MHDLAKAWCIQLYLDLKSQIATSSRDIDENCLMLNGFSAAFFPVINYVF